MGVTMNRDRSQYGEDHDLNSPSAFTPDELVSAVRVAKGLTDVAVPAVCVLDFDGDLTDWLVRYGKAAPFEPWACFHTKMYALETDGVRCGVIARTIGGPYAVLIAEQLLVSGAQLILGLTAAGRVSPSLPLPSFVVVTRAVRDEGTSFHYLPPAGGGDWSRSHGQSASRGGEPPWCDGGRGMCLDNRRPFTGKRH